jgi:hypothetical protein
MGPKYGYLTIHRSISAIWKRSLDFWRVQKKIMINSDTSFATKKYAILNLSKKHKFSQSEQYYIKLAKDLKQDDITHIKIYLEYMGESLTGGTMSNMMGMVNHWIKDLEGSPIKFLRIPIKDNEIYFSEVMEEEEVKLFKEEKASFCSYCGFKIENEQMKFCAQCGTERE